MSTEQDSRIAVIETQLGSLMNGQEKHSKELEAIRRAIEDNKPKLMPLIAITITLACALSGANAMWVNLRVKPIEIQQARSEKDFDRLYDDIKILKTRLEEAATIKYVDEKSSYLYHDLKNKIPPVKVP